MFKEIQNNMSIKIDKGQARADKHSATNNVVQFEEKEVLIYQTKAC
jgi:hypothetical protein